MKELRKFIKENTVFNVEDIEDSVSSMVSSSNSPIPLSEKDLLHALKIEGEFLVLKMNYDDFKDELISKNIMYKISQSLSVIVSYEDDGNHFINIEEFVNYIHNIIDKKQNYLFGIKKVTQLSKFPITILFSGILPINQLKMSMGKKLHDILYSSNNDFTEEFTKYRDLVSQDIGVPLLPLFPSIDTKLNDYTVTLVDLTNEKLIAKFDVTHEVNKDTLQIYLLKLFYIYRTLVQENKSSI